MLLCHRVGPAAPDPQLLAVAPENFTQHLQLIRDRYVPIGLTDLVSAAARGAIPARAVEITFDDGYADNLSTAKPLLEDAGTPATVFAVSGHVDRGGRFWWMSWSGFCYGPVSFLPRFRSRSAEMCSPGNSERIRSTRPRARRHAAAGQCSTTMIQAPGSVSTARLCARLRIVDEPEREGVLQHLRAVVRQDAETEMPRPLTADELARLVGGRAEPSGPGGPVYVRNGVSGPARRIRGRHTAFRTGGGEAQSSGRSRRTSSRCFAAKIAPGWQNSYSPANTMIAGACALVLALVVLPASGPRGSRLVRILDARPLVSVGVASYSIFLWHEPLIRWLHAHGLTFSGRVGFVGNLLVAAALTGVLSAVTYRFVEAPALRLRFRRSRDSATVPASQLEAAPDRPSRTSVTAA